MFHADTLYDNEENFGLPEIEERDLSASLTLRWSRKRKRWECRNAFFWQDAKNKWSCRSQDGRYYYGFRSLRALDEQGDGVVYARCPKKDGLSMAVYNRLIRAAAFRVIQL